MTCKYEKKNGKIYTCRRFNASGSEPCKGETECYEESSTNSVN